jgi:signal transduction histidine kinase/ActR/RegA family two-component response regulator
MNDQAKSDLMQYRVLVLAPTGRDAQVIVHTLAEASLDTKIVPDVAHLRDALGEGAGCVVLAKEALDSLAITLLATALAEQPAWSDLPIVLLVNGSEKQGWPPRGPMRSIVGSAIVLERPMRKLTLLTAVRAALGSRRRQYEVRDALENLREAKTDLEQKVEERTGELRQQAAQLRLLAGRLTLTEQQERRRIARVLHDNLQQLLVASKLRLTVLSRHQDVVVQQATREVEQLIDDAIQSSRSLTGELSPPILHEGGLDTGLEWLARWMADRHGLFVDLALEPEAAPMPDDVKILLFEAVRELLFNSVKHARTRSAVVNLRYVDHNVQVVVSDQGVGFDPKAIPSEEAPGGGYGLFSIRERIQLVGGKLEMESAPGSGSRFVLTAPLTVLTAPATSTESTRLMKLPSAERTLPANRPKSGTPIRVLVADDHIVMREGLARLLSQEPDIDIVGQAADGQEAVRLAAALLPDVILMDVSMPKLNGVEATRAIRNEYSDIRIIGLSMFEEADRAQALRDAGAIGYLTKSGPPDELLAAIRGSVNQQNK